MSGSATRRPAEAQARSDTAGSLMVLVVDDEPVVRAFVARALTMAGFDVAVAAGGREALKLVAEGRIRPAVLVTDIEMPGMTGVELAARLLALRPALRVVMMTGDVARAEAARGHPSIVDEVLIKPMRTEALLEAVQPTSNTTPIG